MSDMLKRINDELQDLKSQGCNIPGISVVETMPQFFKPIIRIVEIDAGDDSRDIFAVAGGLWAFSYQAIKKFTEAGGITFDMPKVEKDGKQEVVSAFIKGSRFNINGMISSCTDGKSIDLPAREAEVTEYYTKAAQQEGQREKWDELKIRRHVEQNVKQYMMRLRLYASEYAISGAKSRVVLQLLGLRKAYTIDELNKSFVILSVVPDIDAEDQRMKEVIQLTALGLTDVYFPSQTVHPPIPAINQSAKAAVASIARQPDIMLPTVDEFADLSVQRQRDVLRKISARKGLSSALPIDHMSEQERMGFYERMSAHAA